MHILPSCVESVVLSPMVEANYQKYRWLASAAFTKQQQCFFVNRTNNIRVLRKI